MSEDSFESEAGDVSLDFANTNDWHASDHPKENLHTYEDLITWGKSAGLISQELAIQLARLAKDHPEDARHAYSDAIQLRESIYSIFSKRYAGKPISEQDLDVINSVINDAKGHQKLVPADGKFTWEWKDNHDSRNIIVWKVALSAVDLLTSDRVSRVRECEDDRGCGYLFIDMTRNHSRRWCSMDSCGNRAKARRHYSRSKK